MLSQDPTPLPGAPNTPAAQGTSSIQLAIIPLDGTLLAQSHGKNFSIKLINNGEPIDLNKLQLKITLSDGTSGIKPQAGGGPITELSGNDVKLDTPYELTLDPATTQVTITLQLWYDNKQLEGAGSTCTLTWDGNINAVTNDLIVKMTNNQHQEALDILKSSQRAQIQPNASFYPDYPDGTPNMNGLLVRQLNNYSLYSSQSTIYKDLVKEILTLPGIDLDPPFDPYSLLEQCIKNGNIILMTALLEKNVKVSADPQTTILHYAASLNSSHPDTHKLNDTIQHICTTYLAIVNAQDAQGNTALHIAIKGYKNHRNSDQLLGLLNQLIAGGVKRHIKNGALKTPKELVATEYNSIEKCDEIQELLTPPTI